METKYGTLGYCSNIHPGEIWAEHFQHLKTNIPLVKAKVSPHHPMGLGLRIADLASKDLQDQVQFNELKNWLEKEQLYIYTLNGFPFGGFHDTIVKDHVHTPDWTHESRKEYTLRLAHLLSNLLPERIKEAGISTSPLSYRFWWKNTDEINKAIEKSTLALIEVVEELDKIHQKTGKIIHIDIEPEPDGILENHQEFLDWYLKNLLPLAQKYFAQKGLKEKNIEDLIKSHIQICFDICHFGVSFDQPKNCIEELNQHGIKVGKIQISSALKVDLRDNAEEKLAKLKQYQEPVYLHQVKAKLKKGGYVQFRDLDEAFDNYQEGIFEEWRIHFHVPLFLENYGLLGSTQKEIIDTLEIQKNTPFSQQMEIETYTWGVLPSEFQVPIHESIIREIDWVKSVLNQ
ncbi:metabolite traffic protein EboE [Aquirufa sp. ROCK-SH2]